MFSNELYFIFSTPVYACGTFFHKWTWRSFKNTKEVDLLWEFSHLRFIHVPFKSSTTNEVWDVVSVKVQVKVK